MMRMKRFFSLCVVFAMMYLVQTAAANPGDTSTPGSASQPKKTIIFYTWEDPTMVNVFEGFNKVQNEIFVDIKYLPAGDYDAKLITLLAAGVPMDLYNQKATSNMYTQYANGYIQPLDDLVKKHGYNLKNIAAVDKYMRIDGKLVGIPYRLQTYYTFYNKKVFAAAGVPTPDTFVEKVEWTWEKFQEIAKKLSSGDGKVIGSDIYTFQSNQIIPALQAGRQIITDKGQIDIDNTVVYSFKMRKSLEQAKAMIPYMEHLTTKLHYSNAFYKGNVGMLITGEWFVGMLKQGQKDGLLQGYTYADWGLTRLPNNEKEYSSFGSSQPVHIHAASKNKDEAFKYLAWLSSPDGGGKLLAQGGFLPVAVNDSIKAIFAPNFNSTKDLNWYLESPKIHTPFSNKYGARTGKLIADTYGKYSVTAMSDDQLMKELRAGLQEIIDTTD